MPFDKLPPEKLAEIRRQCLQLPEMSHDERARNLLSNWPGFSKKTLATYSRISCQCTEKVFNLFLEDKVGFAVLEELCGWKDKDQDFIVDEYLEKKWTPKILRNIRRLRKETGLGYSECIGRATGKIDPTLPKKGETRRSLDTLLTEIADKGARWRAMVQQALEMIEHEEAAAGIHEAIFAKVVLLREIIGNQYDYVNARFNRYMNMIRKRFQDGGMSPAPDEAIEEGAEHGDDSGAGQGRVDRKEGAPREDGSPVPHPADEG